MLYFKTKEFYYTEWMEDYEFGEYKISPTAAQKLN